MPEYSGASISRQRARPWYERHGLLLSTVVAFLARFPGLGASELSVDETWTWYVTDRVLVSDDFWGTVRLGVDAPLFVAVNVLFAKIRGLSVEGLRTPPAIFGTLSVLLIFIIVKRRHSANLALPVALLAALSPFLVFYSRDARPYAQLLFFALVFTLSFEKTAAPRSRSQKMWLGLWALTAVASHYFALVFLAAFFAVILSGHLLARRRSELRDGLRTGVFVLAAVSPLLFVLRAGLRSVSVPYWQLADVDIPGILAEQFLFLGTTLPGGGGSATFWNLVFAGLLVLPLGYALRRHHEHPRNAPLTSSLWWAAPLLVDLAGVFSGRNLLFYPRGFIPTTPFLLAYWVFFTRTMQLGRWKKRIYRAVLLAPFLFSSFLVMTQHPAQPYYRGREVLAEIARDVERDREDYDIVLVHHWWMAQCYYYFLAEPETVWPLGRGYRGESAPLRDLENIPADARLLLVVNELATSFSDPEGKVAEALKSTRPLIRERECLYPSLEGAGLLCSRVYLFGARSP